MQLSGVEATGLENFSDVEKGRLASETQQREQQQKHHHHQEENRGFTSVLIQTSTNTATTLPENNRKVDSQSLAAIARTRSSQGRQILEISTAVPSRSLLARIWHFATQKSGAGNPIDHDDPPDGGVQAWTIVIICHLVGFHTWGFLNAFGVLQSFYVTSLGRSPSDISWIGSLQAFFLFFMSTFSGRLTDAGYFHQLLFVGSTLQVVGFFAASFATTYWQLLICHSLCIGLGGGVIFIPSVSLVATYFRKHRPVALALVVCGNSAGGLFYAAILQNTLPSIGYPWAMRICGFIMLATLLPANFMLKPRHIKRTPGPLVEWKAFIEPAYGFFSLGMFMSMVGMWIPVFYLGSFGRDIIHLSTRNSENLILIINGVGLAGRLVPTALAPSCGPLNLIVPLTFFSAVILFGWVAVTTSKGAIVWDIFYGMVMAAAQGMLPPSLGSMTHDLSKMGVRLGMVFSVLGFALLIGNPFAGWLISVAGGRYLYAQMYAAGTMTVGAILLGIARFHVTGKKVFVKV